MNANREEFAVYTKDIKSTINNALITGSLESGVLANQDVRKNVNSAKIVFYIEKVLKRFADIIGGLIGCFLLVPLMILIKFANLFVKDYGPLFYTQTRIGKNGKEFKLYKFRSMIVDADKKLADYLKNNEEARHEYDTYKKLKNDPRITKVGKFIRKTSIDEFPQFINVLKGNMSLVGPRPYLPDEKEDMGHALGIITNVKPGITGLWQVSGRSNATFKDRLVMDREYYYNWSLKCDIKILLKTIKNCILGKGAI